MATDTKVAASKENAQKVIDILDGAATVDLGDAGPGEAVPKSDFEFLAAFAHAAHSRLPSDTAIDRDRKKKRAKK